MPATSTTIQELKITRKGTDSVPIIRVFVSDLSGTVYIDSQVDLS